MHKAYKNKRINCNAGNGDSAHTAHTPQLFMVNGKFVYSIQREGRQKNLYGLQLTWFD